ncbi:hypothetical protein ABH930_000289 [Kitasatospora sp. GAS204A]|uniref:hypothetical protein n=1 Tax=unclassified Kitasatospora TaxID=2633591 RepID=UPI0024757E6F|nr:hypothetical protein [Kitasatospora sp. GAS204B]MDH6116870.1 hypothetical protein [Kitasatospora sp. GAS204B]
MTGYMAAWLALITVPGMVLLALVRTDRWLDWRRDRKAMRRQVDEVLADAEHRRHAAESGLFAINPEENDPS